MKPRVLIWILAMIGLISGLNVIVQFCVKAKCEADYKAIRESVFHEVEFGDRELHGIIETLQDDEVVSLEKTKPLPEMNQVAIIPQGLQNLILENPSVIGWISIDGTNVDYPLVQHKTDNEFYLHRDIEGNESYPGSVYLDTNHVLEDFGLHVLYAHNMKNGSMFHDVTKFLESQYLEEHSSILLYSRERVLELEPVYCYAGAADASYRSLYESPERLETYLHEKTGMDINGNIFVLITCSYSSEDERIYLICREKL